MDLQRDVFLHICCGPCAISVADELTQSGRKLTGYFFNPNIAPLGEYLRRREGACQVAGRLGFELRFAEPEYAPQSFLRRVAFREAKRCPECYAMRIDQTARAAKAGGFAAFSSSLLYSKYQDHAAIIRAAEAASKHHEIEFLYRDFRGGWERGIALSKEWEIYRQPYCGCVYSEFERYQAKLAKAQKASALSKS